MSKKAVFKNLKVATLSLLFGGAMAATAATSASATEGNSNYVTQQQFNNEVSARHAAIRNLQDQMDLMPYPYEIGDRGPGGGIVFYLDEDGQSGLEAAPGNQAGSTSWDRIPFQPTYAFRDGINAGLYNTERIAIANGAKSETYGAEVCTLYHGGDFGDWYLPSTSELRHLYEQRDVVGGLGAGDYWSSNEYLFDDYQAEYINFGTGNTRINVKNLRKNIRCIRAF